MQPLNNFEDCIADLDNILQNNAIDYFKNQDSTIAVIEISNSIGGYFINNWGFDILSTKKGTTYSNTLITRNMEIPSVVKQFYKIGMRDPEQMIRIIFSAYYKKLNIRPFSFIDEANKIKSYWVENKPLYYYSALLDSMKHRENDILRGYEFSQMQIGDTLITRLSRSSGISNKKNHVFHYCIIEIKR